MAESALLLVSVGQMVSVMAWKDGLIQEAAALLSYALAAAFLRFPFLSDLNSKFKLRLDLVAFANKEKRELTLA